MLAQLEFDRARELVPRGDTPRAVYDQRQAQLTTAGAELTQALAEVYQIRVSLGLLAQPDRGGDLGQVPSDLDETFSSVLEAQAALIQSAAQLGVVHSFANHGSSEVRFLAIVSPGVFGPEYFVEIGEILDAAAGGPPDLAAIGEVMRRHGLTPA